MNIFGVDINSFGTTAGIIYMIVFISILGVALWWGFSNLHNSNRPKKSKKEKKRNKSSKKNHDNH